MNPSKTYLHPEIIRRISRLELRARTVVEGFLSGLHASPHRGYSVEFSAYREYAPGDDIRHIDWRVFGRSDRLYIKQYEEDTNLRSTVLLDCSGSMAYPEDSDSGRITKWDYAATVAASIAYLQVRQRDAVGLILFDEAVRHERPPASSMQHLSNLVTLIESQTPHGATDPRTSLHGLADRIRRRGLVVLISDLLADLNEVVSGLQRLRHAGHDVLVLHVMDRDEIEFPFSDWTLFEGLEQRLEIRTDPQSLRIEYQKRLNEFLSRIRSYCMDHRIDYVLLSTEEPLEVALTAFLAKRMHRIRRRSG